MWTTVTGEMVEIGLIASRTIELRISDKLNEEQPVAQMLRMKADTIYLRWMKPMAGMKIELTLTLNVMGWHRPVKITTSTPL